MRRAVAATPRRSLSAAASLASAMAITRALCLCALLCCARAANPVGGKTPAEYVPGMADPNIHFFDGQFLMFATHDFSVNNSGFTMRGALTPLPLRLSSSLGVPRPPSWLPCR